MVIGSCGRSSLSQGLGALAWFTVPAWGRRVVSGGEGRRKWAMTFVVARFCDALCRPPISWVPPCVPPTVPPGRAVSNRPTSLYRGEGHVWGVVQVASELGRWGGVVVVDEGE